MLDRSSAGVALVAVVLCVAAPVHADGAREADARKSFDLGSKLYSEGAFREALAAFKRAFELDPRPSSLQNVAQCYRDLKEFANAYETYEELVNRFGSQLKQDKLDAARKAIDELALVTAAIRVTISEPDAHVSLDGKDIGNAPFARPIRVSVGEHTIVVTREGFAPLVRKQEVRGGETFDVTGPLERDATGRVSVTSTGDPSAKIYVDDRVVGPPPWEGPVQAGEHRVQVRGEGTASLPWLIEVVPGQRHAMELDSVPQRSRLVITSNEPRALVFVDDVAVARGVWEGAVPEGAHRVDVRGAHPVHKEIVIKPGDTYRLALGDAGATSGGGSSSAKTLGYVGLGAGIVGLGVGAVTGVMALSKANDLKKQCPSNTCFGAAKNDVDSYNTVATISTIGFVAGAAFAAAGTIALAVAPSSPSNTAVVVRPGWLGVAGVF